MTEPQFQITVNGSEVTIADLELLGYVAAMADERVFDELIRPRPYAADGFGVYKAILPYDTKLGLGESSTLASLSFTAYAGTVIPTSRGDGSVLVRPFRAIVGSTTTANPLTTPESQVDDSAAMQNWHETRSGIFVASTPTASALGPQLALGQVVAIAQNVSGNPRWDLLYAQITVDGNSVPIRAAKIKDPSSSNVSIHPTIVVLKQAIQIKTATGVAASSPSPPTLPADAPGVYNIPLALIWVQTGNTATTIYQLGDIRDAAPIASLSPTATGVAVARPASGNNDQSGTYAANNTAYTWDTSAASHRHPSLFLPPSMQGETTIWVEIDATTGTPSHASGSVVDESIDWRNRFFATDVQWSATAPMATDPTASLEAALPSFFISSAQTSRQLGNSLVSDNVISPTSSVIAQAQNASNPPVNLYIDFNDGKLKVQIGGTALLRMWARVTASGMYPNP